MALYKPQTQLNYGKYKGKQVKDILNTTEGKQYLLWLHNSNLNVKMSETVLQQLN